jgi:hypothetical protein
MKRKRLRQIARVPGSRPCPISTAERRRAARRSARRRLFCHERINVPAPFPCDRKMSPIAHCRKAARVAMLFSKAMTTALQEMPVAL